MGGLHSPSSLAIRPAPVHFMLSKSLSIIKLAGAASMGIFRAGGRGKRYCDVYPPICCGLDDPKRPVVTLQNFQQFRYDFPVFRRRKAAQKGRSGNDH